MNLWQEFIRPDNLSQAISALAKSPGAAIPIAGGTDLILDLEQGRRAPIHTLVDVSGIKELLVLDILDEHLFVGAGIPVNHIVSNLLVVQHAQALAEACELIAGPQVRNVATLGGNVAHALPAADGTIALLALKAEAEIAGIHGRRRVAFKDLFAGPGRSTLKQGEELLVGFYLPVSAEGQASCFKRIMRPQGVALPIINLAVWLERNGEMVKNIHIAVGPGGATPWSADEAEKAMTGKSMNNETVNAALAALLVQVGFRSSPRRANADYRRHLVEGLFRDTLKAAWERTSPRMRVLV
jgi:xanthine dehydrogenase FAD-binding subunit